jgi:hypothetical protein
VKHIAAEHGPLAPMMKRVRTAPYSYTSNEPEASQAALGNFIYVIEVRGEARGPRSFWLGYKYRAYEKYPPAGGGRWLEHFKFKNASRPCEPAEGGYFDTPVEITEPGLSQWLRDRPAGMAEIPAELLPALDSLMDDPRHEAKAYR